MQRLNKNHDGYHGETIDIRAVLREAKSAAQSAGWSSETFCKLGDLELLALRRNSTRKPKPGTRNIYISTGVHGDEPAGPLAVLELLKSDRWPDDADLFLLPCLNPTGFILNSRENEARKDLNRDYRHFETEEVTAHVRWLERQPPFDLTLCLHEDWESHGFYLYELNPDHRPSLAAKMVTHVAAVCPIDLSPVIEGREAAGGIINPNLDPASRPQWPEAFWLLQNKTRLSYTLEAPSDFSLQTRVRALVAGVNAALSP
ncbi:MAG TPA: M14 family metallocarboxypeptidase [Verrucomicrobiota bacterium]|nr:M14 family metallocarboxypeptidase [Verrucomicrobiota bacterium]